MIYHKTKENTYDARKRDPQFAHASSSPLWELVRFFSFQFCQYLNYAQTPLLNHYHPAISLHAHQLLSSQPLTSSADLSQNTLSHFLDRFVYKNPKQIKTGDSAGGKGASAMQPSASAIDGVKLIKGEVGVESMVNEAAFLKKHVQDVPVDQVLYFFPLLYVICNTKQYLFQAFFSSIFY